MIKMKCKDKFSTVSINKTISAKLTELSEKSGYSRTYILSQIITYLHDLSVGESKISLAIARNDKVRAVQIQVLPSIFGVLENFAEKKGESKEVLTKVIKVNKHD